MKHFIFTSFLLLSILIVRSQTINPEYVNNRLIDLNEIFLEDFLSEKNEALSSLVNDAEIVLLGEQHHGDGNVFEVKTRLIEYLIKYHDFEIVLFETDFYGGYEAFNQSNRNEGIEDFKKTMFRFWSMSSQMNSFWQLANKEEFNNISLSGFDVHHFSKMSKNTLVSKLDSLVTTRKESISDTASYTTFRKTLQNLLAYKPPKDTSTRNQFFEMLSRLKNNLIESGISVNDFWIQEINNIGRAAQFSWQRSYRDKGMAENIIWLKENHFKEKKMIIWAQNAHIFKEVESWYNGIPGMDSTYAAFDDKEMGIAMGSILSKKYGNKLKSFGVISHHGSYSSKSFMNDFSSTEQINGADYEGPAKQLHDMGFSYCILPIDFDKRDIFNGILMNASGHNFESKAKWGEIFDAIIFVDEIKPIKLNR